MPLLNETTSPGPPPRRRRWAVATALVFGLFLLPLGALTAAVFSESGLQCGTLLLIGQVGTAKTMGSAIPHGFYTEYYRSHDLTLPQRRHRGPYASRIATLRLGPLVAGFGWIDLSGSHSALDE